MELGMTYLFISHDLRAVRYLPDRVAVMYLGELVEVAAAVAIGQRPLMPYTRALMAASPALTSPAKLLVLTGDVPSAVNPPSGCRFHTRCPYSIAECSRVKPQLREIAHGHMVACIRIGPEQPDIDKIR